MDLLNKRFATKQVLRTDEMNQISVKIDEIITYLNTQEGDSRYMVSTIVGDGTSSYLYFLQTEERAMLTASATTSVYSITTGTTHDYPEDYVAKVEIDKGSTGRYAVIASDVQVLRGQTLSLNIKGHLSTAQSRIRVTFTGTMSGASASWNGYAQLTTMSMSPANVGWHNPFIEGSTYGFGSFTITGSLQKTVHVNVTGDGYSRSYTDNIGTRTYSSNYYFTNIEFPSVSGVYDVEIYVESGILESAHYTYKIMCVSAADAQTKKLVCINEIGSKVTNASNSYIFAFAIYNGGATTGTPVRTITARYENTDHELSEETLSLATGIKHSLNYYLDITTGDNAPTITAKMTYGNEVSATLPIDNSASYPPTSGAVFRMNAATRTNSQANREDIVNDAGSTSYTATWTKVAFVDGMDGWTVDDNGRSCLAVNAGSKVDIAYSPLSSISSTLGKTIVLTYKVRNVSNYGEDIITIASIPQENPNRFVGLRIRPDEICLHSSIKNTEDSKQNYYIQDEDVVNASIVIAPNYRSPLEYGNFAQIYVNGAIKCEFSWDTSDSFTTNGHIILGSETADLYVYSIEVYNNAFSFSDAHVNYVASLPTTDDKADETEKNNAVINDSNEIDFSKVRTSANYFVIEMLDGKSVPNFSEWTKKDVGLSNLEMHYHEHHEWDWKVLNVETMGQGTTSMNYFRWNLRWRIDKSTNGGQKKYCYVQYDYNAEYDTWGSSTLSKTVMFDREHQVNGNLINVMRITAKKNYASSQQSHKMGTTSAYNDLRKAILGDNEAGGRTAVFQVPAYGFEKYKLEGSNNYEYRFIGLFTIGPDKGDKPTFAYNNGTYRDTLITMEGVDHDKRLAVFRYPWNSQVAFADESLCIDMGNGTYETGWEVGNCCGIDTEKKPQDALAKLVTEFKPAYEIAYKNSPFIMGLDPTQYTLEDINDDINAFGALRNVNDDYRPFNHYEFYFDGVYDLYFLNVATKKYELSGVNLLTDLGISASSLTGLTLAQKDARFRELRRTRFRNAMDSPNSPWNLRDCLFTHTFLTILGATDNHAKNSYPYRFLDKFCWRQDDLDTIFDTDNQGHSTKKYSIEFKDWTDSNHSAYVFKGEDSAFWTLIEQCYPDELRAMGNSILTAMATLSPVTTGNTLDRLMGFFQSYYWDNAQDYFTKSAYNLDARYAYEEASLYFPDTYNPGVDPLEQSHGGSIEDEKRWVERRLIYAMSKYHYGPFVNYTDVSLGRIAFRSQLAQAFTLKPAMDLYPVIITGDNSAYFYGDADNGRTWDGTTCTMTNVGGSNTDVYIMAADYLRSIGDLCKLAVDSTTISGITISSKRLEVLKVGDIDPSKVTSNLKTLTLSNCPALLTIDARNLTNLTSSLNLVNSPRVREVYLGGTDVRTVNFAQGCKVTTYELSNSITALELKDLKFLTSVDTTACATKIQKINISGCDYLNSFQVMYEIWTTVGNVLQDIRITDVDIPNASDNVVEMLYKISAGLNSSGQATTYNGLDADGNVIQGHPYISGRIEVNKISTVYYNAITSYFPNLEIIGEKESPSVDDIGLVFVGDTSTMMENATETRQFSVTANKQIYESVTWDGQFPNVEGAWLSSSGLLRFDNVDVAEARNTTTTRTIKITATSIYNSSAKVVGDILLQAVRVNSITLNATTQRLLTGGTAEVNAILNPSNNTKGKYLAFRSEDTSVVTITQAGVVTAIAQGFGVANVVAYLSFDESMFGTLQFTVNDTEIINAINEPVFDALMTYIHGQGWSEEAKILYRSEAHKVTSLNTKLKGKTELYSFNQFEYFTGVTTLSATEFRGCTNLESIELPESITYLPSGGVFQNCSSLTYINLKNVKSVGASSFNGCTNLNTVFAPSSIVGAPKGWAIQGAWTANANRLVIIGSLKDYLEGSFFMNAGSVPFSSSGLFAIGTSKDDYEFITDLVIPNGVTQIPSYAFCGCNKITSLDFNNVTSVLNGCFDGCTNLTINPKDFGVLTYIGGGAFRACQISGVLNLESLTSIGDNLSNTFTNTNITGAYFKTWYDWMMLDFGRRMGGFGSTDAENYLKNIYIGNTYETKELVTSVDMSAYNIIRNRLFVNNQSITEITGTENIKYLGIEAFVRCRHIKKIDLHNATTFISSGTSEGEIVETSVFLPSPFNQCPELEYVLLPKIVFSETAKSSSAMAGYGSIGNFCYGCNSIKVIDLGEGFERSNGYFRYRSSEYGISGWSVVTLVLRCKSMFILSNKSNVQHLQGKVYVPSDLVTTYQENSIWASAISSSYISGIYAIGGTEWTTEFGGSDPYYDYVYLDAADQAPYMLFKDANIKSVLVTNFDKDSDGELSQEEVESVTAFAGSLFASNTTIKTFNELRYFKNVIAIPANAFQNSTLEEIDLKNIRTINSSAFSGCSSLQSVSNIENITTILGSAFYNCKNLVSFDAPNLTSVGRYAFRYCSGLRNFNFKNLTSIEVQSFQGCGLVSVGENKIKTWASLGFGGSTYLASVDMTSATSISGQCFSGCTALSQLYLPDTPPSLSNASSIPSTATFYVTSQSVKDAYLAASTWSDYDESRFVVIS